MWEHRNQTFDKVLQHQITSISARAAASLNNHWRIQLVSSHQNGQTLFHVVDIESWNTISMFSSVVEKLS
jgi:hypothetical protein